jgi:hypothetical protein
MLRLAVRLPVLLSRNSIGMRAWAGIRQPLTIAVIRQKSDHHKLFHMANLILGDERQLPVVHLPLAFLKPVNSARVI